MWGLFVFYRLICRYLDKKLPMCFCRWCQDHFAICQQDPTLRNADIKMWDAAACHIRWSDSVPCTVVMRQRLMKCLKSEVSGLVLTWEAHTNTLFQGRLLKSQATGHLNFFLWWWCSYRVLCHREISGAIYIHRLRLKIKFVRVHWNSPISVCSHLKSL